MYCPTPENAPDGFLLARSHRVVEVRYLANSLVRRITHYPSLSRDEELLFEGLIRLNSSSGLAWLPTRNLAELFPLRVGEIYRFTTDEHLPGRSVVHVENEISVLRKEKYSPAGCKYDVLRLDTTESNGLRRYLRYAPSLKCVLTEQIGRAPDFGFRFYPLSALPERLAEIAKNAPKQSGV
jgi:hypothetical protein